MSILWKGSRLNALLPVQCDDQHSARQGGQPRPFLETESSPHQGSIPLAPWPWASSLQKHKKYSILYELFHLQCLVIATQKDWENNHIPLLLKNQRSFERAHATRSQASHALCARRDWEQTIVSEFSSFSKTEASARLVESKECQWLPWIFQPQKSSEVLFQCLQGNTWIALPS